MKAYIKNPYELPYQDPKKMNPGTYSEGDIPLKSGLNIIGNLDSGTLLISDISVPYGKGYADMYNIGRYAELHDLSIIIIEDVFYFEVIQTKTESYSTTKKYYYKMESRTSKMKEDEINDIIESIEKQDNFQNWENGINVINLVP